MPDEKAILIALYEYTASMRILAERYAEDMAEIRMQHANEIRLRQRDFDDAMRDHREKLTQKLGIKTDD